MLIRSDWLYLRQCVLYLLGPHEHFSKPHFSLQYMDKDRRRLYILGKT